MERHRQAIVRQHAIARSPRPAGTPRGCRARRRAHARVRRRPRDRRHVVRRGPARHRQHRQVGARRDQRADVSRPRVRASSARRRHGLQSDTACSLTSVPSGTGCASRANFLAPRQCRPNRRTSCISIRPFPQLSRARVRRGAAIAPPQAMIASARLASFSPGAALVLTIALQPQLRPGRRTASAADRLRRRGRARKRAGLQRVGRDARRLRERADPAAGLRLSDPDALPRRRAGPEGPGALRDRRRVRSRRRSRRHRRSSPRRRPSSDAPSATCSATRRSRRSARSRRASSTTTSRRTSRRRRR